MSKKKELAKKNYQNTVVTIILVVLMIIMIVGVIVRGKHLLSEGNRHILKNKIEVKGSLKA